MRALVWAFLAALILAGCTSDGPAGDGASSPLEPGASDGTGAAGANGTGDAGPPGRAGEGPGASDGSGPDVENTTANRTMDWGDPASKPLRPGVQAVTQGAQCTTNFLFTNGTEYFLGYAAHCAGTGGQTATNGCEAGSLPLGTQVELEGATAAGRLAYSSWLQMQADGETGAGACAGNDFALVQIASEDLDRIHPAVLHFGGPTGLRTSPPATGDLLYSYGASGLRFGQEQSNHKVGVYLSSSNGGWSHDLYTVSPGIPGDSGSGIMDADGAAFGVASTLEITPVPGSNNFADLARALEYMEAHAGWHVDLVTWDHFDPSL